MTNKIIYFCDYYHNFCSFPSSSCRHFGKVCKRLPPAGKEMGHLHWFHTQGLDKEEKIIWSSVTCVFDVCKHQLYWAKAFSWIDKNGCIWIM